MKSRRTSTLCSGCERLISTRETRCPHCAVVQPTLFGLAPRLRLLFQQRDATVLVIAACGLLYVASLALDPSALTAATGVFGLGSPSSRALFTLGMTGDVAWVCGHFWTLLTASLLHGSLVHIAFNLVILRWLGTRTQEILGPARFVVLFFGSGASGFLMSNLATNAPTIGASASVFGLMGALLAFGKRRGGRFGDALNSEMFLWAAVMFLSAIMFPHVNHMAHLGGFAGGLLIATAMPRFEGKRESRAVRLLALALVAATLVGLGLSIFKGVSAAMGRGFC